eukprot:CAMPEP_0205884542 /NCGR_PEP_ID=MMETSP1083-20121108/18172_1 /ASSEMBLY_ACC=CAM_ASM_000430 /TAXON_ID=97485 /ORGANISM="Prymnesium parvum, Strain Texoma1" /LENGTH=99 /DNA_ID=CAMNT_0053247947 /DNA_START=11 /DNA_END=307 /DNA_ORIENTATION=+
MYFASSSQPLEPEMHPDNIDALAPHEPLHERFCVKGQVCRFTEELHVHEPFCSVGTDSTRPANSKSIIHPTRPAYSSLRQPPLMKVGHKEHIGIKLIIR